MPTGDMVLDYPLAFRSVFVARRSWSKADKGVLCVDDIVARLLVANSEADKIGRGAR